MIKLNSSFEGEIVKYYDLFFLKKEKVEKEISYIMDICGTRLTGRKSCIDIGCGTGAYDEQLSEHFGSVTGMDISADMIEYAKANHMTQATKYILSDARCMKNVMDGNEADLAVSLAHVIGYQLDNTSVEEYFKTVCLNLKKGGLFWFNFYNQPALFLNALSPRHMKIEDGNCMIYRLSNASINADNNCLDMDYYYIVSGKGNPEIIEIHEKMRYFSKFEMEYYLEKCGFDVIGFYNYSTDEPLSAHNWNAGVLAKKR